MSQKRIDELTGLLIRAQAIVKIHAITLDQAGGHIEELAKTIIKANAYLQVGEGVEARKLLTEAIKRFSLNEIEVE